MVTLDMKYPRIGSKGQLWQKRKFRQKWNFFEDLKDVLLLEVNFTDWWLRKYAQESSSCFYWKLNKIYLVLVWMSDLSFKRYKKKKKTLEEEYISKRNQLSPTSWKLLSLTFLKRSLTEGKFDQTRFMKSDTNSYKMSDSD